MRVRAWRERRWHERMAGKNTAVKNGGKGLAARIMVGIDEGRGWRVKITPEDMVDAWFMQLSSSPKPTLINWLWQN
jgi:hypothetical protein